MSEQKLFDPINGKSSTHTNAVTMYNLWLSWQTVDNARSANLTIFIAHFNHIFLSISPLNIVLHIFFVNIAILTTCLLANVLISSAEIRSLIEC